MEESRQSAEGRFSPHQFLRGGLRSLRPYRVASVPHRYKLDANESPFDVAEDVKAEIAEEFRSLPLNRYPDSAGVRLKQSLAERLNVPEGWIALGNGSDELIADLILALARPDARVIAPQPTFSMYGILARVAGVPYRAVPLDEHFELDADALRDAIRPTGTHLFFFSYPNNPTGNCWDEEIIASLLDVPNVVVIVDEAYYEFSGKTWLPRLTDSPNLIILRTFSKAYGLAGLRVGYMIARPAWIDVIDRVRLPYNVNSFSQVAATVLLKRSEHVSDRVRVILDERRRLATALAQDRRYTPFPSEANFVLFRAHEGAAALFGRLAEAGVLVRNLDAPGLLKNCLRVTAGGPEETKAFLGALAPDVPERAGP